MKKSFKSVLRADHPILRNHVVRGLPVLPGLAYVDMLYGIAARALGIGHGTHALERMMLLQPLSLRDGDSLELRTTFHERRGDADSRYWEMTVESVGSAASGTGAGAPESAARTLVTAELRPARARSASRIDPEAMKAACDRKVDLATVYAEARERGLVHAGTMKALGAAYLVNGTCLIEVGLDGTQESGTGYAFHPAILDGAAMASGSLLEMPGPDLALPTYYASIACYRPLPSRCYAVAEVKPNGKSHVLDLAFHGLDGEPLALVEGIAVVAARGFAETPAAGPERGASANHPARSAGDADAPAAPGEEPASLATLRGIFARHLGRPAAKLPLEAGFFDLGLQSSQLLLAMRDIEKAFGITLNPTVLFENSNLADLHRHLDAAGGGTARPSPAAPARISAPSRASGALDIAVVGLAGRYPQAEDIEAFWANIRAGRDCITEVPRERWDWRDYYTADRTLPGRHYSKWGGFISGADRFDPLFFNISPGEAELLDPQDRLILEHCWLALEDAGYTRRTLKETAGTRSPGSIGVFMGAMFQEYPLFAAEASLQGRRIGLDSGLSSMATRISYFWDFHGPSMTVDTACSSSLTAIYLACRALKEGRINGALAGGVSLSLHPNKYLMLSQAQFISSRGHCAAFGVEGDGYIPGEGVGVVFLKRLEDAERDRDRIHGVIKGAAINHGGKASAYTVPNPRAQQEVVAMALAESGFDPETIGYVETHGTGTSLGDPIEIAGLAGAFGKPSSGRSDCWIGSVKSNIGHCESAAGVAGLTKLLMQMRNGEIAPSLHSRTLNPHIDFAATPFRVNQELRPWQAPEIRGERVPRRAGLSSFGAGGSNAHLVLEEYRPAAAGRAPVPARRPREIAFVLSARDGERLLGQARRLAAHLEERALTETELLDLAYTLQVGREEMEARLAILADSREDLIGKLRTFLAGRTDADGLFVGGMSEAEAPLPAAEGPLSHPSARLAAWVRGGTADWAAFQEGFEPRRTGVPSAPFLRERCWINPEGTRRPEDVRGTAPGSRIHPLLHRNISDFSAQRFATSFRGTESFLAGHRVHGRRTLPAVAYLEMVRAALEASSGPIAGEASVVRIRDVAFSAPLAVGDAPVEAIIELLPEPDGSATFSIRSGTDDPSQDPIVHCEGTALWAPAAASAPGGASLRMPEVDIPALRARLGGNRLDADACYAAYRARGIEITGTHRGLVEVFAGQGEALAAVALPSDPEAGLESCGLHPGLMDAAFQASIALEATRTDARLWAPFSLGSLELHRPLAPSMWAWVREAAAGAAGGDQDASPATSRRFDIDLLDGLGNLCVRVRGSTTRVWEPPAAEGLPARGPASEPAAGVLLLKPAWKEAPLEPGSRTPAAAPERHVYLAGIGLGEGAESAGRLRDLLEPTARILALPSLRPSSGSDPAPWGEGFEELSQEIFAALKARIEARHAGTLLCQVLVPAEGPGRILSAVSGLLKTASLESPAILGQVIEVPGDITETAAADLLRACGRTPRQPLIRFQDGKLLVETFADVPEAASAGPAPQPWKEGGAYLITGGLGGLGLLFAREIAARVERPTLYLAGRSDPTPRQAESLAALRASGARVEHRRLDIGDRAAVASLVRDIRADAGGLHGILHAAGLQRDNFILRKTPAEFAEVLAPKTSGTRNLDAETRDVPELDFFVLFSSISGVAGKVGQADYSAANAFQDAFARCREALRESGARHGKTLSINWPLWREGGMGMGEEAESQLKDATGMEPMATEAGLAAFRAALADDSPQILVMAGETGKLRAYVQGAASPGEAAPASPMPGRVAAEGGPGPEAGAPEERALAYLKGVFSKVSKVPADRLQAGAPLERYGIDSVMITRLTRELEKDLGTLSKTLFFEYPNLREIARHLAEAHRSRWMETPEGEAAGARPAGGNPPPPAEASPRRGSAEAARAGRRDRFSPFAAGRPRDAGADFAATPLDIAIIGISGRFPKSPDLEAYWRNLRDGEDCITEIPADRWDWRRYYSTDRDRSGGHFSKWGGFLDGVDLFDPMFFNIPPREAEKMDPQERLFLEQAWLALEDAGYRPRDLRGNPADRPSWESLEGQVGVYAGVMFGDYHLLGAEQTLLGNPLAVGGSQATIANRVSHFLDLHGPSMTVDTMCSSTLTTLHLACQDLRLGRIHLALAGGVNLTLHPNKYLALSQGQFLSGEGHCRSFGLGGDGYVPGEGVGVALLKRLEDALRDGDAIHAVIKGSAVNHGGRTHGYSVPNPKAQASVIRRALRQAGIEAERVSYVEAHGTGTRLGDPIEMAGLAQAFGADRAGAPCWIGSAKSNIGHCESAAGMAGIAKVILQMRHGLIAPSLHSREVNPNIDFGRLPFRVNQELRPWHRMEKEGRPIPRIAGISSFGAGGANAHLILEESPAREDSAQSTGRGRPASAASAPALFVLSARSEEALRAYARKLRDHLRDRGPAAPERIEDLAYSFQVGREALDERLGLAVRSLPELESALGAFLEGDAAGAGIHRGHAKRNKQTLSLFETDEDLRLAMERWIERGKHAKILELWTHGMDFDWSKLYGEGPGRIGLPAKVRIPTYPFEKSRHWPELMPASALPAVPAVPAVTLGKPSSGRTFHAKAWKYAPLQGIGSEASWQAQTPLAILATPETRNLAARLAESHFPGARILMPEDLRTDAEAAAGTAGTAGTAGCIDLAGCGLARGESLEWIAWLQNLIANGPRAGVRLLGVTSGLESYRNASQNLAGSTRAALYRMLGCEYGHVSSGHLDLDPAAPEAEQAGRIASEYLADDREPEVCYREGSRYASLLSEQTEGTRAWKPIWEEDAADPRVLLVTGGTRGLGYRCAEHFIKSHGVKRVILCGRETLPAPDRWQEVIAADAKAPLASKLAALRALESLGAEIRVLALPLADGPALASEIRKITRSFGRIGGVIHCAGTLDSGNPAFIRKPLEKIREVLEPKVEGTEALVACLRQEPLRFFAAFSTVSAAIPALAAGQSDYAMANAHMDYLAESLAGSVPLVSIQWPTWRESGMGAGLPASAKYRETALAELSDAEGLGFLDDILARGFGPTVLPVRLEHGGRLGEIPDRASRPGAAVPPRHPAEAEAAGGRAQAPGSAGILAWLVEIFAREMRMPADRVETDRSFAEYGVDSVLLSQFSRRIGAPLEKPLDPSILFQHTDLQSLAAWLSKAHGDAMAKLLAPAAAPTPAAPLPAERPSLPEAAAPRSGPTAPAIGARPGRDASAPRPSDIAVVGMTCRFPGAENLGEYWALLSEGRSAVAPLPAARFGRDPDGHAGLLRDIGAFDPAYFLIPMEDARAMDPQALVLLEEGLKLFCQAGYAPQEMKGTSTGVYIGARSRHAPAEAALRQSRNPILATGQNYLATNLSRFFDLRGPSLVVDTACSSALVGMNLAVQDLRNGDVDAAVVGGVSLLTDDFAFRLFRQRNLLSREADFHLFDGRASGVVLGEGAGLVLLKTLERARKDGDQVLAVLKGLAINNDGRTAGPAAPNIEAHKAVMRAALLRSGLAVDAVSHIEANGSGSEVTDLLELKAIEAVYPAIAGRKRSVGSVKPNIGHPLCAEGIAAFIKVALMIRNRARVPFLSGTRPMQHYDVSASPFVFLREGSPWTDALPAAALNCFADGGTNAHILLSADPEPSTGTAAAPGRRPIALPILNRVAVHPAPPAPSSEAVGTEPGPRLNVWKNKPRIATGNRWKRVP